MTRYTVSIEKETNGQNAYWVATIKELPAFRVVCATEEEAVDELYAYIEMIGKIGKDPHPFSEEFYKVSSLDNWVKCRRAGLMPNRPLNAGPKWLGHYDSNLNVFGITEENFIGILDANFEHISHVCLIISENIVLSDKLKKRGESHLVSRQKVLSDETANFLICLIMDCLEWNGVSQYPDDLVMLLKHRLIQGSSRIEARRDIADRRLNAAVWAGRELAMGKTPTFRSVARRMQVEASTVMRWFTSTAEFKKQANRWKKNFNSDGSRREFLWPEEREALRKKLDAQH